MDTVIRSRPGVTIFCRLPTLLIRYATWVIVSIILISLLSPVLSDTIRDTRNFEYWADENYPPFEFKDEDGNAAGFSVDIMKAIAKEEGFSVNITPHPWDEIKDALTNDSIDFSGTMAYDINRTDRFAFSVPIITLNWYLYVPDNSGISSLDEVQGKRIVLAKGDIWEEKMRLNPFPAQVYVATDYRQQLTLLSQGKFDAAIINKPVASYLMEKLGINNIKPVGDPIERLDLCIASHISHPEQIGMINEGIVIITRNGRYNEIQNYWFAPLEYQYESELFQKVFFYVIIPSIFIILVIFTWLWSVRKIVVLKTAELQQSEKRYTLTLEAINDGLWDLNIKTGKTFFSPQYYRMAGYEPDDFPSDLENWLSRIHDSDVKRVKEALSKTLADGRVKYQVEFRFQKADGSFMWTLTRGKVVEYDSDNKPLRMVGTHTDITDLKNAELKLKESQRTLNTLIDNLEGMVYRCLNDPNWTMVYLSDGVLSLTGYEKEEVLYNRVQSYAMIIHPDDQDMVWDFVQKGVEENKPYRIIYRIISKNGDVKWVWEQGRGVFEDKTLVALEGYIADITKETLRQKTLEKMEYSLEHLNEGIIWFDAGGRIFEMNISCKKLIGQTGDSISDTTIFSLPFILPTDSWTNLMEKAKDNSSSVCDAVLKTGDERQYFRINTSYCEFGEENVFCSIIEDHTAETRSQFEILSQKETLESMNEELLSNEEELRQNYEELNNIKQALQISEKKYRAIFEDAVLGIFQTSLSGDLIEYNSAFAVIFGFSSPQEMKTALDNPDTISFSFSKNWVNALQKTLIDREIQGVELKETRCDGTDVWISMNVKAVRDEDGQILLFEGSIEDISRRINAELENERALIQIKKNIAELTLLNDGIRNPLTIIEIIAEDLIPEKQKAISFQVKKIDSLITQLDNRWVESLKIIQYLKKHHEIDYSDDFNG
ncbi:PAS domain-containing protein [Methanospirillum stamsii]|uniref:histidine kinase n=1 Tax=Methanospirillum stamsii TaxID=1277351 RepID=A0A2V2MUP8_9EURY|nr:PAS domain-containing protein [Methanospirillum stamsii]PWR71904.1 hypothetical protein DLD82_12870 [Methanospirillum stamsii]